MSHWPSDTEREDGDNHDETRESVIKARKWLRGVADRSQNESTRGLVGDLRQLELNASGYFLGLDYDSDDRDDVDDMGPY